MNSNLPSHSPRLAQGAARLGIIAAVIAIALVGWGIFSRMEARAALVKAADEQAAPTVAVIKAAKNAGTEDLVLPGNIKASADAPIYARSSGYVKRWLADIGTPVKAGQLLAELDIPELEQQTAQAQADLATAQANDTLARSTSERWQALLATDSVSKQEADEKAGDAAAKNALVQAAKANLSRLKQLQSYENIVAPFDGVITARNLDVGDLINAGAGGQKELFHITAAGKLRVYVQVPQVYAASVVPGTEATLKLTEQPGRDFPAKLVRTSKVIDATARTLLAEFEADGADGALLAGSYAEVHIKLASRADTIVVPANALLFGESGLKLATVDASSKVALKPITVGRDFGASLEVLSGIGPGDTIILNPADSLADGESVRILPEKPKDDAGKAPAKDGAAK